MDTALLTTLFVVAGKQPLVGTLLADYLIAGAWWQEDELFKLGVPVEALDVLHDNRFILN